RTFGRIPDAIAAAGYDSVNLLAIAIGQPGDLRTNLQRLDNVQGVQGLLRPAALSPGETSNTVAVVRINEYGAPQVAARYAGGVRARAEGRVRSGAGRCRGAGRPSCRPFQGTGPSRRGPDPTGPKRHQTSNRPRSGSAELRQPIECA